MRGPTRLCAFIAGLMLAGGLATVAQSTAADPLFASAYRSHDTGVGWTGPRATAVGDLNGDGKPDVAVANYESTSVSILLGDGEGGFGQRTTYDAGGSGVGTMTVAIGDLNGDGHPDVAAGSYYSGSVTLLFGDGNGSFMMTSFATGTYPYCVEIRDLNGDGYSDLVMSSGTSTAIVSVFLGTGGGGFGPRTDFGTGLYPHGLAIGDVNGDGKLDLVTANNSPRTVSVLLGNGGGSFGAKHDFSTSGYAEQVVIGDLNGDGKPDLATANYNSSLVGTISVLLGNGDGTFGAANTNNGTWPSGTPGVALADLNSDGKRDLVAVNYATEGMVSVLLGNGAGVFTRSDFVSGSTPYAVVIADMNVDGKPDLVTTNYSPGTVAVLLGNGDATFGRVTPVPGNNSRFVALRDLNGDGRLDLVAGLLAGGTSVSLGNGDGSFGTEVDYPAGGSTVVFGDLNGDGKTDLVTISGANVSVLLGNGDGGFGAAASFPDAGNPTGLVLGDVNGDGALDVVTSHPIDYTKPYPYPPDTRVSVLLGNGNGLLGPATYFVTARGPRGLALADLNGDGNLDFVAACYDGNVVSALYGNGQGVFTGRTDFATAGARPISVAIADLDPDGIPDMLVANSGATSGPGLLSVLHGNGAGGFGSPAVFPVGRSAESVEVRDLNGDGALDVAVGCVGPGAISVLLGSGAGSFAGRADYGVGYQPGGLAVGDLNGDGSPDLLTGSTHRLATVLLNSRHPLVGVGPRQPIGFALLGATPNPARGRFHVDFSLPEAQPASIELFDVSGRRVDRRRIAGLGPGLHRIALEPRVLAPGVYLIRLNQGRRVATVRAIVIR